MNLIDCDVKDRDSFKDIYEFDFAFNVAYNQVIYLIVLLYMIICPSISLFGAIYFAIKYFIDKYNLVYVYPISVQGEGDITRAITSITQINIILVEFLTYTFFINSFQAAESGAVLLSVLFFQVTSYLVLKCVNFEKGMKRFAETSNFMSEIDEMKYEYELGVLDESDTEYYEKNFLTNEMNKEEDSDKKNLESSISSSDCSSCGSMNTEKQHLFDNNYEQ